MSKGKKKRIKLAILDSFKEKALLNKNPGKLELTPPRRPTKKQRRHRGWRTPQILQPTMKFSEMVENAFEPVPMYDDWADFRDGMRDIGRDKTRLVPEKAAWFSFSGGKIYDELTGENIKERNKRIKKEIAIRKARKKKRGNLTPEAVSINP